MDTISLRKAAILAAFLISCGVLGTSPATASINVSPIRVHLDAGSPREVVTITNGEETPKSYQVEVVAWSQSADDREVYSPTEDVIAVPPLFTLEPGEQQLIRLGALTPPDAQTERAFRMFVTEVASPQTAGEAATGIDMRLQIGLPVFYHPVAPMTGRLEVDGSFRDSGNRFVRLRNTGNSHVKILELRHQAEGASEPVAIPTVVYVHAGQTAELPLPVPGGAAAGRLSIVTESHGTLEHDLPPAP
ncbi:MAG: fimbria/pilus periplasmic chaperone [Gammaproteobacteria bacterium]